MHQVALIHNPRSRRNRGLAVRLPAGLTAASPMTPAELLASLQDYARREVDLLIVSGGDGTLRDVLGLLPRAYGDAPLPAIALLAAGNANLVASDVGACMPSRDAYTRLIAAAGAGRWRREESRRPIAVQRTGEAAVLGFFMGLGALNRATQYNHDHIRTGGGASVAITIAASMWQALRGVGDWAQGDPMTLRIDDETPRTGSRFLFLASSLHNLMLGLWPFWGSRNGTMRYLDIDAPPPQLARSLLPLLRGRPTASMLASGAYRSSSAHDIEIRSTTPMIVDGEPYPAADGCYRLAAGPALRFVTP
ncbi:Diacylglycerol kinase family enzyme [Hydrocarboniphaga daqingensis]|uniref:Diacylglycerol kinase family enzyme n=1 Tax=Hydrocarboniphaga daqingensis TaxID=490188 RepID=A0A1M5P474_9GAMM|nr:diacylglycerol kinase family protein [Hydrocarboniphaga daqingensis]SHG96590.1 Diacylglycerol kinase family enzyme [Hydrocarboniphaga daqingensis]